MKKWLIPLVLGVLVIGSCTVSLISNVANGGPKTPTGAKASAATYTGFTWRSNELAGFLGLKPDALQLSVNGGKCQVNVNTELNDAQKTRLKTWLIAIGCVPGSSANG